MSMFSKTRIILGFALLFVIVLLVKFALPSANLSQKQMGAVERGDLIQRVTIAGVVVPNRRTMVYPPYKGFIKKIYVHSGDQVDVGSPIAMMTQSLHTDMPAFPLRAPFPGTIVQVEKTEGEYVKDDDAKDFIARIDDLSKLFILASAPEIDRVKIKNGQEVIIKASAILHRSYKGIIRDLSISAKEKEQWRQTQVDFPLRIEVTDMDENLKPGMSVVIDIIANRRNNVLTLRHEFLEKEDNLYFATLQNGKRVPVEVGLQNEDASEITKGLSLGDKVKQIDFSTLFQGEN